MAGQFEIGDRVRFKARGLPDNKVHLGWTEQIVSEEGDRLPIEHSWQEYFGGETGVVQAVDNVNGQVAVRSASHSQHGHPFLVWIAPEHLVRID